MRKVWLLSIGCLFIHLTSSSCCSYANPRLEIIPHINMPSGNFMDWSTAISNIIVRCEIKKTVSISIDFPTIIDEVDGNSIEKNFLVDSVQQDCRQWLSKENPKIGLGIVAPSFSADYILVDDLLAICSAYFGNTFQQTEENLTISLFPPLLFLRKYSLPIGMKKEDICIFPSIEMESERWALDGRACFLPDDNTFLALASKDKHNVISIEMKNYSIGGRYNEGETDVLNILYNWKRECTR